MGIIMSRPKTSCTGVLSLVLCYFDSDAKSASARITIHGSVSSTYVSCRLHVRTRFPGTLCILSIIAFACGFPGKAGLVLIGAIAQ